MQRDRYWWNLCPVAKIEAIRLFATFAAYHNFIVYQMDVKSEDRNGELIEEVYVEAIRLFLAFVAFHNFIAY